MDGEQEVREAAGSSSLELQNRRDRHVCDAGEYHEENRDGEIGGLFTSTLAETSTGTLLDERALAQCLCVSARTVRRMVGRGQLPPGVKLGGRRIWMAGKVIEYLQHEADRLATAAKRRTIRLGMPGG